MRALSNHGDVWTEIEARRDMRQFELCADGGEVSSLISVEVTGGDSRSGRWQRA
jgi:hypothetical protein